MIKNIVIILLILLIVIFIKINENMINLAEDITDTHGLVNLDPNTNNEITTISKCNKNKQTNTCAGANANVNTDFKIQVNYGSNTSLLNNDGRSIYQNIDNPLLHICTINNIDFNLIKIEFVKSNLTYNNKPIALELHLIHNYYNNINNYIIVLPLDFTSNVETFINIDPAEISNLSNTLLGQTNNIIKNYNFTELSNLSNTLLEKTNDIKKNINSYINKYNLGYIYERNYDIYKISVNNLFNYSNDIPKYECCGVTIGSLKKTDLCQIQTIVNEMTSFKIVNQNNDILYISEPVPFDVNNGIELLNALN